MWASPGPPDAGAPEFQARKKIKNNFSVTVGETFNRVADFGLRIAQNAFGGRAPSGPAEGSYSAPTDSLAVIRGTERREGKERVGNRD